MACRAAAATARCWSCRTGRCEVRAAAEMTSRSLASRARPRRLLATPSFVRLWFAGGVGNAMRWLEMLVAGIFTYDVTHSAFLVAVVTVTRSLPMLFLGPI